MAEKMRTAAVLGARIRPDTTGFAQELRTKLAAIEKTIAAIKIRVNLDFSNTDMRVELDTADAEARLRELGDTIDPTLIPDVDDATAQAQLAALARPRTAHIKAFVDDVSTNKVIDALAKLSGGKATGNIVKSIGDQLGALPENIPKISAVSTGIAGLSGAALAATSNALALGSSLATVAGAAGPLPAAAAAVASMGATLLTALNGLGAALGEASDTKTTAAVAAAETGAQRITEAQRRVADAEQAGADSVVDSARRTRNAREALTAAIQAGGKAQLQAQADVVRTSKDALRADRGLLQAQKDLTSARAASVRGLQELDRQLKNAALDSRGLEAALEDARQAYAQGLTDSSVGTGAVDALKLAMDKASQAVSDNKAKVRELTSDKTLADKQGIDGAERVLAAEQAVADARESQVEAAKAAADARAAIAQTELDATRQVRDAREALGTAERDGARSAERAAVASADAARALTLATTAAATQATSATAAMDALTPSAREAAGALLTVKDRLGAVKEASQENFFAGFSQPLLEMSSVLIPQLERGMGRLAGTMGDGFETSMGALEKHLGGGVLEGLFDKTTEGAAAFNEALEPMVGAIVTLGEVGVNYLPRMGESIADMSEQFAGFIERAQADGSFDQWIETGLTGLADLGSAVGSIGSMFASLGKAAQAGGGSTLSMFADGAERVAAVMEGEVFQTGLATIFAGGHTAMDGMGEGFMRLGDALATGAPIIATVLGTAGQIIGEVLGGVAQALNDPGMVVGLTTFFSGIQAGVQEVLPHLPALAGALGAVLGVAGHLAASLGPVLGSVLGALAPLLVALSGPVTDLASGLGGTLLPIIDLLIPGLQIVTAVISVMIQAITEVVNWLGRFASMVSATGWGDLGIKAMGSVHTQTAPGWSPGSGSGFGGGGSSAQTFNIYESSSPRAVATEAARLAKPGF